MAQIKIRKEQISGGLDGWISANETWTYASDDDPTYTFTISGDKTSKYSAGMRIKLTDSGTQYFIITKVAYSSPNTTVTVYGGTDYDLSSGSITNPYYSMVKAPQGFPLDPDKWSVIGSGDSSQSNPSSGTTYNVGGSIDLPIGAWKLFISGEVNTPNFGTPSAYIYTEYGLGTTTSSLNICSYLNRIYMTGGSFYRNEFGFSIIDFYNLSTKDTYYLNAELTYSGSVDSLGIDPFEFRAISSYL